MQPIRLRIFENFDQSDCSFSDIVALLYMICNVIFISERLIGGPSEICQVQLMPMHCTSIKVVIRYFQSYINRPSSTFVRQCLLLPYLNFTLLSSYPQHGQTSYFSSCPHFRHGLSTGFLRWLPTVSGVSSISVALYLTDLCAKDVMTSHLTGDFYYDLLNDRSDTFDELEARSLFDGILSVFCFDLCVVHTYWIPISGTLGSSVKSSVKRPSRAESGWPRQYFYLCSSNTLNSDVWSYRKGAKMVSKLEQHGRGAKKVVK